MDVLSNIRKLTKQRKSPGDGSPHSPPQSNVPKQTAGKAKPGKPADSNAEETSREATEAEHGCAEPVHRQVRMVIVGAGQRGQVYASYAQDFPEKLVIAGVAEPVKARREFMEKKYNIPSECVFQDWKQAAKKEKFADAVVIATLDQLHKEPVLAFAKKGYHILLEKPMAPTEKECEEIVAAVGESQVMLGVAHVLRYTPRYKKVKEMVDAGVIGDVVSIQHMEPIGWFHFAHSYVRGNWRRQDESSFSLLTKSCHDIDLINSLVQGAKCTSVSSFGSLVHFTKDSKPPDASSNCLSCKVERSCPYSAVAMYLEPIRRSSSNFFTRVVCNTSDIEEMRHALKKGPYGRCVYDCDNDVASNQVVNMAYEGGRTVSFMMTAFTERVCQRETKIFGTRGQIKCSEGSPIVVFDFASRREQVVKYAMAPQNTQMHGHGFADYHLMDAFVTAVATGDPSHIISDPAQTMQGHRLVFAIEKARLEQRVVNL